MLRVTCVNRVQFRSRMNRRQYMITFGDYSRPDIPFVKTKQLAVELIEVGTTIGFDLPKDHPQNSNLSPVVKDSVRRMTCFFPCAITKAKCAHPKLQFGKSDVVLSSWLVGRLLASCI